MALIGLHWLQPAAAAEAKSSPRFKVAQGKGWSVCESYVRFLNAQPVTESLPLCHLRLSPDLKEPNWEELDIRADLGLVYSIEYPPYRNSLHPDKPPPSFDQWKSDFERQIQEGRSPRLRRTHLALVEGGPVETVLAYKVDQNECKKAVQEKIYSQWGGGEKLLLWDKNEKDINEFHSELTFSSLPTRLLIFRGKPLVFWTAWSYASYPSTRFVGAIVVSDIFPLHGGGDPYGNKERCQIGFDLPPAIVERMTK